MLPTKCSIKIYQVCHAATKLNLFVFDINCNGFLEYSLRGEQGHLTAEFVIKEICAVKTI